MLDNMLVTFPTKEDLEGIFFPTELQTILMMCQNIPLYKQNVYIPRSVCCITKSLESDVSIMIMVMEKSLTTPKAVVL